MEIQNIHLCYNGSFVDVTAAPIEITPTETPTNPVEYMREFVDNYKLSYNPALENKIRCNLIRDYIRRLKRRYPRKLKKAIGQLWDKKIINENINLSFSATGRTKWQRKALYLVKFYDNIIELPTKSGWKMYIELNQ